MASGLFVIAEEADGTQSDLVRADNGRTIQSGDGVALTIQKSYSVNSKKILRIIYLIIKNLLVHAAL